MKVLLSGDAFEFRSHVKVAGRVAFIVVFVVTLFWTFLSLSSVYASVDGGDSDQTSSLGKSAKDILELDIEQLARTPVSVPSMDIPVTSVTKEPGTVGRSAAAVFVITNEMIRRSGVTNIPDALRMVPGMEVAQINSSTWAISCRGFNMAFANKLLVLIDGRAVYNPDFAGVYWNLQDVVLEDVERIEVIRGPGGTLWGANAVNGVINIITKKAKDSQGTYVSAGGGSLMTDTETIRYGGQFGENGYYRVYGKHFEYGSNYDPAGKFEDGWRQGRFGFRADWEPDTDYTFTVQGDHYIGNTDVGLVPMNPKLGMFQTGENVLMRLSRTYEEHHDWSLQAYYDNMMQQNALMTQIDRTLDIEFQYRFPVLDRHVITCGAGFRSVDSYIAAGDQFGPIVPTPYFTTNYTNQFVQDEISLIEERLTFILGCKLEQNPYTGLEYQPTARLLYTPDNKRTTWAAVSRAVRTPSRAEEQATFNVPIGSYTYFRNYPGTDLVSEAGILYEVGYREQTTDKFSWDITTFYGVYQQLITPQLGMPFIEPPYFIVPAYYTNDPGADTFGVELATNYTVSERWRLFCQYTMFQIDVYHERDGYYNGHDPHNQVYFRSSWDLRENLQFDLMARYVDALLNIGVPSYITMDMRLAWRARRNLEVALVGQNLLQDHHLEYNGSALVPTTEVPRSVYATLTWRR